MIYIQHLQAVQNVRGEGGAIKYSDFRDLVIHLRIERKSPLPSWSWSSYQDYKTFLMFKGVFFWKDAMFFWVEYV